MHVSLMDDDVAVFAKPDASSLLVARLKAGDEMDLGKSVKSSGADWVEAALADGRRGYIPGDTRIHKIRPASLRQDEADMFERPSFEAARKARLKRGERFLLMETVKSGGADWVRIRDARGHDGYIHGETAVHMEDETPSAAAKPAETAPSRSSGGAPPRPSRGGAARKAGALDIRNGLVAMALGGILTGGSYLLAPQLGGRYYITWGLVVLGALWFLRGVFRTIAGR